MTIKYSSVPHQSKLTLLTTVLCVCTITPFFCSITYVHTKDVISVL